MQHNPSTDLIECMHRWDPQRYPTPESRHLHALEIIQSGADIHSVTEYNRTCLHLAISHGFLDVVQLLLKKGIDVNAQTSSGDTALHMSCASRVEAELVPMLLYHGADPWILNNQNATPLDCYLIFKIQLVATIEHLYYHMFDRYTECRLSAHTLLQVADSDLDIFQEIVGTIKEVDLDNLVTTLGAVYVDHILKMPSANLRVLLDKFDYVLIDLLFRWIDVDFYRHWDIKFRFENIRILVGSHLQREFIDSLCEWSVCRKFLRSLFKNQAQVASPEEIIYYLLSYGMEIHDRSIETVYKYDGYNELFKSLRFMDVIATPPPSRMRRLIPRLVFQVTGDIQESIEDPRFWIQQMAKYPKLDFESVLPYYAVPNLKALCCEMEVAGKENFFRKLDGQPQIPLLVELARNVFRKYFVQRLGITSAKQFYESLKLLQISSIHRKIIALETELY